MPRPRSYRKGSKGFSFIEQAIAIPFVLLFVLGSIDVTNYFRAHTALKEGVHEGLRCLYPTDGECMAVSSPEYRPVNNLYIPPFFALLHDYDGREEHLRLPDYSFGAISARTLHSARYEINGVRYGVQRNLYPATGLVKAIEETRPNLSGTNPLTAQITQGQALSYSGAPRGDQSSCLTGENDERIIGALEFDVPSAPYTNTSYLSQINDLIKKSLITGSSVAENFSAHTVSAQLFLKFNGSGYAYNTRTNQTLQNGQWHGHLEMKVQTFQGGRWVDASHGANLGGRDFANSPAQHLVPRGFEAAESQKQFGADFGGYGGELGTHVDTRVPFGSRSRIVFSVRGARGFACHPDIRVGWDLSSAQIVTSRFRVLEDRPTCITPQPLSQCSSRCAINPAASSLHGDLGSRVGPNLETVCGGNVVAHDDVRNAQSCSGEAPDLQVLAISLGIASNLVSDYSLRNSGSAGCANSENKMCPQNFGVTTPSEQDSGGFFVRNSPEAQALCPIPSYALSGTVKWYEATSVVHRDPILIKESDCTVQTGMTLPQNLIPNGIEQYKKLFLPTAQLTESKPSYKFPGDPDELKRLPQFSCSEISIGRVRFDEDNLNNLPEPLRSNLRQSLFNGAHEQLGCQIENILKQEAIRIGMNPAAYFEVTKNAPVPATETQIAYGKVDACIDAHSNTSLATSNLRTKVPGGPFFENVTPPSCIINGVNYCIALPAGVRKVEPDGKYTVDTRQAAARALNAIEAFMPSSKTGGVCEEELGTDCVKIDFPGKTGTEEFDPLVDDFELKASTNLPLLVLGGRDSMTVSYEASRAWEGSITR